MTDEYAHGETETDVLEDEWHERMMSMTDEERKRIIDRIHRDIAEIGKEYDAERVQPT